jgi:hypothetical protein
MCSEGGQGEAAEGAAEGVCATAAGREASHEGSGEVRSGVSACSTYDKQTIHFNEVLKET